MTKSFEKFTNKVLPGNYWITKSMEFSKVTSSGTLWYLKKWMVYYKYLFFKDTITQSDYIEIKEIFDTFIESLPEEGDVRKNAQNFFFDIDIRDNNSFITLNDFLNNIPNMGSGRELLQYQISAKKFYFTYIMNLGGQSGYKKNIKEWIIEKNSYSKVLEKLEEKLESNDNSSEFRGLVNDFPATLRNERQIFFYYGLFHGSEKADLSGVYNLTNIGKTIINSSFDELLLIWEHQKIKMISQSPVTDIQKLGEDSDVIEVEKFDINYHPYVDLLEVIVSNNAITLDEYQYVISRINQDDDLHEVSSNISDILEELQPKITKFNRAGDKKDEDFKKELAKFILGVSEMIKDDGTNYFSFLTKYTNKKVSISNFEKAKFVLKNYKYIINYLNEQHSDEYENFRKGLKEKYKTSVNQTDYEVDINLKYEWSKYIINLDKNIYLALIYILCSLKRSTYDYSLTENIFKNEFLNFKSLLKSFGIKKKTEFVTLMSEIQESFEEDGKLIISTLDEDEYKIIDPLEYGTEVTIDKLNDISQRASERNITSRKRDTTLIQTLKTFYFTNFLNDKKLIKCDCCNDTTFLTTKNYPYIEFHHLIPFSTDYGPDHYLNLFGLCPSCHRKMHFSKIEDKKNLYRDLSSSNSLQITLKERINTLLEDGILEAIHLEFLLKENMINEFEFNEYMSGNIISA